MLNRTQKNVWLCRYAALTALTTLCLICLGGLVTSNEAGMSVPDWPTTYGYNMFFFPISKWIGGIFYEHTHRLLASAVGFMTIILAAWLWLKEARRWLRWIGALALFMVILQGVLGGLRVTAMMPQLGIFHATLAQLFFILVAAIAVFTSRWWLEPAPAPNEPLRALLPWFSGLAGLILLQLIIAATMRHQHAGLAIPDFPLAYGNLWPDTSAEAIARYNQTRMETTTINPITAFQVQLQMAHRLCALCIFAAVLFLFRKTWQRLGSASFFFKLACLETALIVAQITLGAATIWTNKSADITTIHVAVGALSFLVSVLLVLLSIRSLAQYPSLFPASKPIKPCPISGPAPANSQA